MKRVTLTRGFQTKDVTLGILRIQGEDHQPIFSLENPLRGTTVDSCIPAGIYRCGPYSSKKYPNAYQIHDVPGRTYILIHAGNSEKDTTGCVLLGLGFAPLGSTTVLTQSRAAIVLFLSLIGREDFELEIRDT